MLDQKKLENEITNLFVEVCRIDVGIDEMRTTTLKLQRKSLWHPLLVGGLIATASITLATIVIKLI